ncbi:hypothetical protein FDP41_012324 [Naegleria fowleri]|uniref:NDT80 domain-containing protein n=1 Tax=Naegleria fowleri TaxID=5763 RepID=A0A6A5BWN2_NAEFO|nr:uncharacterized protein FDP41_012324 [Naegleria fowleri]KAF0981667.1 hypothetical protein FDP41_012324 [Naegleria fowleri]CAG4719232.1 unnamed protein product [Naegleria fowleri]
MNISEAILAYLNENKHTCDAETMVNNIHSMVLQWQQEQQLLANNYCVSAHSTEEVATTTTHPTLHSNHNHNHNTQMLIQSIRPSSTLTSPATNPSMFLAADSSSLLMMNRVSHQPTPPLTFHNHQPITTNSQSSSAYNSIPASSNGSSSNHGGHLTTPQTCNSNGRKEGPTAGMNLQHPQSTLKSSNVVKPSNGSTTNSSSSSSMTTPLIRMMENTDHCTFSTLNTPEGKDSNNTISSQEEITLFIKPARKTAKYFLMYIPPKLYCSPYKYDLMLRVPSPINDSNDFIFTLRDAETGEKISKNNKGVEAYCIERTKTQRKNYLKPGFSNATFRLNFSVCSFHNGRKPFILTIHLRSKSLMHNVMNTGGEMDGDQLLLKSDPFSIFARKAGTKGQPTDDDWGVAAPQQQQQQGGDSYGAHQGSSSGEEEEVKTPPKKKKSSSKRKRTIDVATSSSNDQQTSMATSSKKTKSSSKMDMSIPTSEASHASSSSASRSSGSSYSNDRVNQLRDQQSNQSLVNFNNQQLATENIATEFDQLSEPQQRPTQQEAQSNTSFTNLFETDQWSQFFENSTLSPDIAPFLEEEIVTCQNQPQPQSAIYQQFGGDSTTIQDQQPAVDLTMVLYQELLKQFNRNSQLPSFISQPKPELNQKVWSQQIQQPQYQQQTLQNTTTVDPLDLSRLLRNNISVQAAQNTNNNNLLLSIDESLYTKLFGSNYNPNNYFFNN